MENMPPIEGLALTKSQMAQLHDAYMHAHVDKNYRQQLIANPKEVLRQEGVALSDDVKITMHEFDPKDLHFFLLPFIESTEPAEVSDRPPNAAPTKPIPVGSFRPSMIRPFTPPAAPERTGD